MATHSSTLAWKIPWTEEPGNLQSVGSQRVGHNRATSLSLFTFMHWIRKIWYIYTMEYYSVIKTNTFKSVLMKWMNLEPIIQSVVSQKEKN